MSSRLRASATVTILRSVAAGGFLLALLLAFPAEVQAQAHGATIFKTCVSPKKSCSANTDCPDPNSCSGLGICTTVGTENVTECTITLINTDPSLDDITVLAAEVP